MKKLVIAMGIGLVAMSSYGSMQVGWSAGAGFFWDPTYDPLLSPGGSTFAQLLYSPDYIKDNLFLTPYNDTILATYNITEGVNSSVYGDFDAGLYTQAFTAGYVYGVVWQDVGYSDFYFHSAMLQLEDITGNNLSQILQLNTDLVNGNPMNTPIHLLPGEAGVMQIPEPSTALLLSTGGLVVWFGRRKLNRAVGTKVTPKKMRKVDLLHR